jgi:starvation-inducible DNA-binding protein
MQMTTKDTDPAPNTSRAMPVALDANAVEDVSGALNILLADMFGLYIKSKNFHWHVSGPQFHDYHILLDKQADQLLATTDALAERVRKIGGKTIRSIAHIGRLQRIRDNDAECVPAPEMLAQLRDDNRQIASYLREAHRLCDEHEDLASASLLENLIDEAEQRSWFLFEATGSGEKNGL